MRPSILHNFTWTLLLPTIALAINFYLPSQCDATLYEYKYQGNEFTYNAAVNIYNPKSIEIDLITSEPLKAGYTCETIFSWDSGQTKTYSSTTFVSLVMSDGINKYGNDSFSGVDYYSFWDNLFIGIGSINTAGLPTTWNIWMLQDQGDLGFSPIFSSDSRDYFVRSDFFTDSLTPDPVSASVTGNPGTWTLDTRPASVPIPEPSTIVILGAGLASLALVRRLARK